MLRSIFRSITGREGQISIDDFGVVVAKMTMWTLTRRAEEGPEANLYDLNAALAFVNPALWDDDDYEKTVSLVVARGKEPYRLKQEPGFKRVLQGKSLLMEGVSLDVR
jgi:hypothetical protein